MRSKYAWRTNAALRSLPSKFHREFAAVQKLPWIRYSHRVWHQALVAASMGCLPTGLLRQLAGRRKDMVRQHQVRYAEELRAAMPPRATG